MSYKFSTKNLTLNENDIHNDNDDDDDNNDNVIYDNNENEKIEMRMKMNKKRLFFLIIYRNELLLVQQTRNLTKSKRKSL